MLVKQGQKVRIDREGPIDGKFGRVLELHDSDNRVSIELEDGLIVSLPPSDFVILNEQHLDQQQPSQPQQPQETVQVKLPTGCLVEIEGCVVEIVIGVARMSSEAHARLQQRLYDDMPFVQIAEAPPMPEETPPTGGGIFGPSPHAPMGYPLPMGSPMGGMAPFPAAFAPPPQAPMGMPSEQMVRVSIARQLLDVFMHMRHHMLQAMEDPNDALPGDEWKQQRGASIAFRFSAAEQGLYDTACRMLTNFLDPNPHGTQ